MDMDFSTQSSVIANNPNNMIKLEPEELSNIASAVQEATEEISSLSSTIKNLAKSTENGIWEGPDANTFRQKANELVQKFEQLNDAIAGDGTWTNEAADKGLDAVDTNNNLFKN